LNHTPNPGTSTRTYNAIRFATEISTLSKSGIAVRATASRDDIDVPLGETPVERIAPELAIDDVVAGQVTALDVLEHVIDEESWIAAFAAMLEPDGILIVRVPVEGPVAWMDALNAYRYVQDIVGRGQKPLESRMKGWHRHYRPRDLEQMIADAGFQVIQSLRSGSPHHDVLQFGALAWGGMVRGDRNLEHLARNQRERAEDGRRLPRLGPFSTKITVQAIKRG
jgi:hypothetical protein